jgi:hypothetical protein
VRRAFATLALVWLATACVTTHSEQPVNDPPPPPAKKARRPRSEDPIQRALDDNIVADQERAEKAGWLVKKVIEVPDAHVALVLYRPSPEKAPAYKVARLDAVGATPEAPISVESGMIDIAKTRDGKLTWDLRGDGARSIVVNLTPCGPSCGVAKPFVLELSGDRFVQPPSAPSCPTCLQDENKDGIPEFELRLLDLKVAPCSRASCGPSVALLVEVRGLEAWDGQGYARDLAEFEPFYFERLKRARQDAEVVKRATTKGKICPLNALQVATRVYVYSRLTGEGRGDALTAADEIMKGYTLDPCRKEYDLLDAPRPWADLRGELDGLSLPTLTRQRPAKK